MSCFRHLETTPFCPADIFDFPLRAVDLFDIPREGARSYRRMGIIAIFFCASLPLAPSRGMSKRSTARRGKSKDWGLASA